MSARDDYPELAEEAKWFGFVARALDEIDRLRLDAAYMEDIARCRGEENERLRANQVTPAARAVLDADRDTLISAIAAAFYDRDPELSRVIVGQVLEAATACGYRVVVPAGGVL